jgi:selenocysteine-specific elongation factor
VPDAKPVTNRTRVHFHLGTAEVLGRIVLLESEVLTPGDEALVQMHLEAPVVAEKRDLFVVRSYSPMTTIGGGRVIDPAPPRHKRMKDDVIESLTVLESGRSEDIVLQTLEQVGISGLPETGFTSRGGAAGSGTGAADIARADAIRALLADGRVVRVAGRILTVVRRAELERRVLELLTTFAAGAPLEWGMSAEELRGKLSKGLDRALLDAVLTDLERAAKVSRRGNLVRPGGADVGLTGEQAKLAEAIESRLLAVGANPPSLEELGQEFSSKDFAAMVKLLAETGRVIKVTSTLLFHPKVIAEIRAKVLRHLESKGTLGVPEFKDLVGVTRKYAIPLLEYFDREGTTLRAGDARVRGRKGR